MKKLLLSMAAIAIGSLVLAQNPSPAPEVKPAVQKETKVDWDKKLRDELKFTEEQATKYDLLSKEYKEKIEAVLNDASLTKEVQKEKKMALKKEKEGKLMEILTPEQQARYKEIMKEKHETDRKSEKVAGAGQ